MIAPDTDIVLICSLHKYLNGHATLVEASKTQHKEIMQRMKDKSEATQDS